MLSSMYGTTYSVLRSSYNGRKLSGLYMQRRLKTRKPNMFEKTNCDKALEYFDAVYPTVYGKKWEFMREALSARPKYGALLNNFSETDEIIEKFMKLGAFDVGDIYTKNALENMPNKSIEAEIDVSEKPSPGIRPSLIELTDDDKAAIATGDVDRYPEAYKRIMAQGNDHNQDLSVSRVIKASTARTEDVAATYDHIPSSKLKGLEYWSEEADAFKNVRQSEHELGFKRKKDTEPIKWPMNLKLFSFVQEVNDLRFPSPKRSQLFEVFTHYLFNASSILPVLALDLQLGDKVLDMCAGPGGKSLAIMQTIMPDALVCNDISLSRINRVKRVFEGFVPQNLESIWDSVVYNVGPGNIVMHDYFDKVLVDAPCLNDRHSLQEPDNSIFKTSRVKERMAMPEIQADLIVSGMKALKPGGALVYSTCTLSPLQNDGSVHLALTRIWRETVIDCTVVDMTETMTNLDFMYEIGHDLGLRYGHIVLPLPDNNCGPMYVCKIIRNR